MEGSEADINFFNSKPSNSSANEAAKVSATEPPQKSSKPSIKFDPSALYYDMSGDKFMLIFNHVNYSKTRYFNYKRPKSRKGTDEDVTSLKDIFGKLDFKVFTHTDKEHGEIIDIMSSIRKEDHSTTSCFVVVILTHGDKGGYVFAKDKPYLLKDLTSMLESADTGLVNKPKLFFVQACRGDKMDEGRTVEIDGPEDNWLVVPSHVDFLFMQSSVDDYLSWRDAGGSWMIQELCEVVDAHHQNHDLLQLITLAQRNVAYKRSSNTPFDLRTHDKKQMPETRFTLTKLVKF